METIGCSKSLWAMVNQWLPNRLVHHHEPIITDAPALVDFESSALKPEGVILSEPPALVGSKGFSRCIGRSIVEFHQPQLMVAHQSWLWSYVILHHFRWFRSKYPGFTSNSTNHFSAGKSSQALKRPVGRNPSVHGSTCWGLNTASISLPVLIQEASCDWSCRCWRGEDLDIKCQILK